jgi:type I restriction enzyme S subunit
MKSNWQIKKLEEVCEVFADGDWIEKKDQSVSGIRLIQTGNIGNGYFLDRSEKARYISEDTFKRLRCTEVLWGDCLLSRLPDPVGRAALIPDTGQKMITAVDCTIMRFKKDILPKWFIYYSLFPDYQKEINKEVTGATRQRISRSNLGNIEISVPPIPEQKRIIKILDEVFEKTAKAKENVEKNLQNAHELFESYLQNFFANPGDGWVEKKLGDVCNFVRGPFGGSLKKSCFKSRGIAVYEQQHAIYNQFEKIRYFIDEIKFNEMQRFEVEPGDLIMSCSGTMGKVAIVPNNAQKGIINQALLKLSTTKNLLARFLKLWMESPNFQNQLTNYSLGAAIRNVASVKMLKEIHVPLPPLFEQKDIITKFDALSIETNKLKVIYQQKLNDLEELKKSILQKAFKGELIGVQL